MEILGNFIKSCIYDNINIFKNLPLAQIYKYIKLLNILIYNKQRYKYYQINYIFTNKQFIEFILYNKKNNIEISYSEIISKFEEIMIYNDNYFDNDTYIFYKTLYDYYCKIYYAPTTDIENIYLSEHNATIDMLDKENIIGFKLINIFFYIIKKNHETNSNYFLTENDYLEIKHYYPTNILCLYNIIYVFATTPIFYNVLLRIRRKICEKIPKYLKINKHTDECISSKILCNDLYYEKLFSFFKKTEITIYELNKFHQSIYGIFGRLLHINKNTKKRLLHKINILLKSPEEFKYINIKLYILYKYFNDEYFKFIEIILCNK